MKSKIKKLKRTALVSTLLGRISAINKASDEAPRDLLSYTPNRLAAELHPKVQNLKIAKIQEFSPDVKSIYLAPAESDGKLAWFSAGQYLSICAEIDGKVYKRPYSIASSPQDTLKGFYMLTVKRVGGGKVSQYILDNWKEGDSVMASAPLGDFTYERLRDASTIIGIAGGSGITPFRALAKAIYEGDEKCSLVLLYGSRTLKDAIFSDDIAAWAKENDKIKLVNVLSDEQVEGCENGFITAELIQKYAPQGDYSIFLCGPQAMYNFADTQIEKLGIRQKFVRHELFGEYFHPEKNKDYTADVNKEYSITVIINGEKTEIKCKGDTTILRAMEDAGLNPPSDCRSGRCGWCHSKLVEGDVYVPESVDGRRLADKIYGYIHPCCTFPLSDLIVDVPTMPCE